MTWDGKGIVMRADASRKATLQVIATRLCRSQESVMWNTNILLGLAGDLVDAAVLAVSELTTNALRHGLRAGGPYAPVVPAELWVWARATPAPQLVVAVFDTCRSSWPDTTPRDLLDERGKGIGIVGVVADTWGAHLSRSRFRCGAGTGQGRLERLRPPRSLA
jgi:hypothetical protein